MTLECLRLRKAFGGVTAVDDVSLQVHPGELLALIGPNGAGKTSVVNMLAGNLRPDAGIVTLDGVDMTRYPSHRRAAAGIARSFQTPRFDPEGTVADALRAAGNPGGHVLLEALGLPRRRRAAAGLDRRVRGVLDSFALTPVADDRVSTVDLTRRRVLEIARIALLEPRYALLDEPAAGLDEEQRELLATHLRGLVSTGRAGVVLVEHNFAFLMSLADRVVVLAEGKVLAEGRPAEIRNDPAVLQTYLGEVPIR